MPLVSAQVLALYNIMLCTLAFILVLRQSPNLLIWNLQCNPDHLHRTETHTSHASSAFGGAACLYFVSVSSCCFLFCSHVVPSSRTQCRSTRRYCDLELWTLEAWSLSFPRYLLRFLFPLPSPSRSLSDHHSTTTLYASLHFSTQPSLIKRMYYMVQTAKTFSQTIRNPCRRQTPP